MLTMDGQPEFRKDKYFWVKSEWKYEKSFNQGWKGL
jgi:hypothetical protein